MAGASFDADIAALTGFHPPESSNPYAYGFSHPPYLPHLLQRAGYDTRCYDNHVPEFMRSADNHAAMGMLSYHSIRDRQWQTHVYRLGVEGPGDCEFLDMVRGELQAATKPSLFFVRTVTNHGPWVGLDDVPEIWETIAVEFPGDATTRGLAAGLRYDDVALGRMLRPLSDWIESGRLLVLVYGDHGIGLPLRAAVPGLSDQESVVRNVPLLIVGIGIKPQVREEAVSIQDIPVTVANLLGLPFARGDLGGRDLLAREPLAPLVAPWGVLSQGQRLPLSEADRALLEYGYGKLAAPR
jgi:phosphoglycerol transferase MdoB-like AlkP superfamily enzyme